MYEFSGDPQNKNNPLAQALAEIQGKRERASVIATTDFFLLEAAPLNASPDPLPRLFRNQSVSWSVGLFQLAKQAEKTGES